MKKIGILLVACLLCMLSMLMAEVAVVPLQALVDRYVSQSLLAVANQHRCDALWLYQVHDVLPRLNKAMIQYGLNREGQAKLMAAYRDNVNHIEQLCLQQNQAFTDQYKQKLVSNFSKADVMTLLDWQANPVVKKNQAMYEHLSWQDEQQSMASGTYQKVFDQFDLQQSRILQHYRYPSVSLFREISWRSLGTSLGIIIPFIIYITIFIRGLTKRKQTMLWNYLLALAILMQLWIA